MNLKIAIVGLPNAGKSTLFNALLKRQIAEAANYPFTTIEPNVGVVPVPDPRLTDLAKIYNSPIIPAVVEFVDIAGLVKGASEGEGLGNKFLSHIRETHIIVNVLRFFQDPSVVHVAGDVDPERDKEIIQTELMLADLQTLEKQDEKYAFLKDALNSGKPAREVVTDPLEVRDLNLLSMKPVLYVANVSEDQLSSQLVIPAPEPGSSVQTRQIPGQARNDMIRISAKTESELSSMTMEEQKAYLHELGLEQSGLDRLIQKAYETLGLISFLTCGEKEVRAWTIEKGMKAPQAAGVIHTDFEKKFIKADVIRYEDFISAGNWVKAREAGKVRSEGRDYEIQDGEVVEFKVGA